MTIALRHLPCKGMQFLRMVSGNSLLEPMNVKQFSLRCKLCTEDDREPKTDSKTSYLSLLHVIRGEQCYLCPSAPKAPVNASEQAKPNPSLGTSNPTSMLLLD